MAKNVDYGSGLWLQYLTDVLNITDISEDGTRIWVKGKEKSVYQTENGYLMVQIYDKHYRACINPEERSVTAGMRPFGMHRLAYVWYSKEHYIPNGYVVHHKNHNKQDNRIENLECTTPWDNIMENRNYQYSTKEVKCKLDRPRKYYEDKLLLMITRNEHAIQMKDAAASHKIRSQIYQYRAKLRYWDSHHKGENE